MDQILQHEKNRAATESNVNQRIGQEDEKVPSHYSQSRQPGQPHADEVTNTCASSNGNGKGNVPDLWWRAVSNKRFDFESCDIPRQL